MQTTSRNVGRPSAGRKRKPRSGPECRPVPCSGWSGVNDGRIQQRWSRYWRRCAAANEGLRMSAIHTFEVPGRPRAKQSARAVRTLNGIRFFQPAAVENYHGRVAALARAEIQTPLAGPISLRLSIVLQTPSSWSKKRRAALNWAVVAPDLDNSTKALMDGLNGIAWHDDRQVVKLVVEKHYGNRDAVVISLKELP